MLGPGAIWIIPDLIPTALRIGMLTRDWLLFFLIMIFVHIRARTDRNNTEHLRYFTDTVRSAPPRVPGTAGAAMGGWPVVHCYCSNLFSLHVHNWYDYELTPDLTLGLISLVASCVDVQMNLHNLFVEVDRSRSNLRSCKVQKKLEKAVAARNGNVSPGL